MDIRCNRARVRSPATPIHGIRLDLHAVQQLKIHQIGCARAQSTPKFSLEVQSGLVATENEGGHRCSGANYQKPPDVASGTIHLKFLSAGISLISNLRRSFYPNRLLDSSNKPPLAVNRADLPAVSGQFGL